MSIFYAAVHEMNAKGLSIYGPKSFKAYMRENKLPEKGTAANISVDSIEKLNLELRENKLMILRLGAKKGERETSFVLVRLSNSWSDFFLIDKDLTNDIKPTLFISQMSQRELFPFQLLPKLTETSMVNLAIGSGLIAEAIGLDKGSANTTFATGQSTFTFDFKAVEQSSETLTHQNGQVEIDALLLGRRKGEETLVIIEAKHGKSQGQSLAKHKLFYPVQALKNSVPSYVKVLPIYLKTWIEDYDIHFLVTECEVQVENVLSTLNPANTTHFVITNIR